MEVVCHSQPLLRCSLCKDTLSPTDCMIDTLIKLPWICKPPAHIHSLHAVYPEAYDLQALSWIGTADDDGDTTMASAYTIM